MTSPFSKVEPIKPVQAEAFFSFSFALSPTQRCKQQPKRSTYARVMMTSKSDTSSCSYKVPIDMRDFTKYPDTRATRPTSGEKKVGPKNAFLDLKTSKEWFLENFFFAPESRLGWIISHTNQQLMCYCLLHGVWWDDNATKYLYLSRDLFIPL